MTEANRPVLMPGAVRNAALGIGFERRLPDLERGDRIYCEVESGTVSAVVTRRCPGPVYWVRILTGPLAGCSDLVSCRNFGGLLDAD